MNNPIILMSNIVFSHILAHKNSAGEGPCWSLIRLISLPCLFKANGAKSLTFLGVVISFFAKWLWFVPVNLSMKCDYCIISFSFFFYSSFVFNRYCLSSLLRLKFLDDYDSPNANLPPSLIPLSVIKYLLNWFNLS